MSKTEMLLPHVQNCTLSYPWVNEKTLVRELIFTYRCSEDCDNCRLIMRNNRTMPVSIALAAVEESLEYAVQNEYKTLQLYLIGGEALQVFDRLREFYEGVQKLKARYNSVKVLTFIETCGRNISNECKRWLWDKVKPENFRDNSYFCDLGIVLRWDSLNNYTKDKIWLQETIDGQNYPDFWKYCTVMITLLIEKDNFSPANLTTLYNNMAYVCGFGKALNIDFSYNISSVDIKRYNKLLYTMQSRINFDFFFKSMNGKICTEHGEKKTLETIDFNGNKYFCKYLSPIGFINFINSASTETEQRIDDCNNCFANGNCMLCRAALPKLNRTFCNMQRNLNAAKEKQLQIIKEANV